jgi:hypothetical protein
MGMDVMGTNPSTKKGEYFRNNVWWWRPLWNYCIEVAPELCENVNGHCNDGDGLDEDGAYELAKILREMLNEGHTAAYEIQYNSYIASLPRHNCEFCEGTGIRTDDVGQEMGMPTQKLEPEIAIVVGRTHGWCNACGGEGMVSDFDAEYPFSVKNVEEFTTFLEGCGGFEIC